MRIHASFIALFLALLLSGCVETPSPRGTAQSAATQAQSRADISAAAADAAAKDAAIAIGDLAAAKADAEDATVAAQKAADAAEAAARKSPEAPTTKELIARASDARVAAVEAAARVSEARHKSEVALAVATATSKINHDAEEDFKTKASAGEKEHQKDLDAASERAWVAFTRWAGLAFIVAAAVVGGLMAWLIDKKTGFIAALILASAGFAVVGFGATVTWLPLLLVLAALVVAIIWAWEHRKDQKEAATNDTNKATVISTLSQALDAVEKGTDKEIAVAKGAVSKAVSKAGLESWLSDLRGDARDWFGHVIGNGPKPSTPTYTSAYVDVPAYQGVMGPTPTPAPATPIVTPEGAKP